jgi:hypothetical protein
MNEPAFDETPSSQCKTARESWRCPNMKPRDDDRDMSGEHYECKVCGRTMFLDYDEMR